MAELQKINAEVLRLEPGDFLLLKIAAGLTSGQAKKIRKEAARQFGIDRKFVCLIPGVVNFGVLKVKAR